MRATWGVGGVIVSLVALGCSGRATLSESSADSGTSPGGTGSVELGGSSAGGNPAVSGAGNPGSAGSGAEIAGGTNGGSANPGGGESTTGGSAGSPSAVPCAPGESPPFQCVASCGASGQTPSVPACSGGNWLCPAGTESVLGCAPDACAVRSQTCCDPMRGNFTTPCGPDGRIAPCPAGQIPNVTQCVPADVTSGCASLANQPCALANETCDDGSRQRCTCDATSSGLTWICFALPG